MDKVVFFSTIKGDVDYFPVQKMSSCKFNWQTRAKQEMKEISEEGSTTTTHYGKCPSFPLLNSMGVAVILPYDIHLSVDEDNNLNWHTPGSINLVDADAKGTGGVVADIVPIEWHSRHSVSESHTIIANGVLKINTSWIVGSTNPNLKLLILPVMTPDQDIFTASGGMLDLSKDINFLNVQGYIRGNFKNYVLRAGTPLMHVIPFTDKKIEIEIRDAVENDHQMASSLLYITSRGLAKPRRQQMVTKAKKKWIEAETRTTNVLRGKANNFFRNTKNWFKKRGDAFS
tara:strand:+ start:3944 stop:4801 length:858 start_codon:yes stop_codon:yes gene_type:complete